MPSKRAPQKTQANTAAPAAGRKVTLTSKTARRIVRGTDFLNPDSAISKTAVLDARVKAATRFHLELTEARKHLLQIGNFSSPRTSRPIS